MLKIVDPKIIEKWLPVIEGSGDWKDFVDGCPKILSKDYGTMAQILENLEKPMQEGTRAADSVGTAGSEYKPILIPMSRRIMPALIGPQIFGTQPLSGPTGLVFALRAVYTGDSVNEISRADSQILTVAAITDFTVGGDISGQSEGIGVIRHIEGNNLLVEYSEAFSTIDQNLDNASTYSEADTTLAAVYSNEALYNVIFSNYTGSVTTAAAEALGTDMKEMGFEIESQSVTAKSRKLKAKWTNELEEDLRAVHSMDAESLLSGIASDEIIMEMNREFIGLVHSKATTTTAFDFSAADGRWEMEKYQNMAAVIARTKRAMAITNRRGQATFMIVSGPVLGALEAMGKIDTDGVDPIANAFAGNALGMKVFVDSFATDNTIYLGYKGPNEVDSGIFYCPYQPLQIRKGFGEEDGQPRTFFSTRYATMDSIWGASKFYEKITVANLPA
jgi:hypothetical protein